MSTRSKPIRHPADPQADALDIEQSDIVELHWPNNGGVELVQVISVEALHAEVQRLDFIYDSDAVTTVRREWLKKYKNA
ncbi:MAG: hypothetical protein AAF711_00570 [Planctomycetota bacterium]